MLAVIEGQDAAGMLLREASREHVAVALRSDLAEGEILLPLVRRVGVLLALAIAVLAFRAQVKDLFQFQFAVGGAADPIARVAHRLDVKAHPHPVGAGLLHDGVPSVYPADTVLDFFTYAGAPGAYDLDGLGAGFGATYNNVLGFDGVTLSSNYVSINGDEGTDGLMTDTSSSVSVTQLGYTGGKFPVIGGSAWGIAAAYNYSQNMQLSIGTPFAAGLGATGSSNNFGLSGYWVPENTGWIPSVSTGWGTSSFENGPASTAKWAKAQSWYVGLQWPDTFVKGNDLGMAVGQAPFITSTGQGTGTGYTGPKQPLDSNYMWEWWYKFQVTDNITVTPALYYIQNYDGQLGKLNVSTGNYNASDNVFGGLLKTTFKF